jgi:chromosome segregation ATPase
VSNLHPDDPRSRLRRANQAAAEERAALQARITKLATENAALKADGQERLQALAENIVLKMRILELEADAQGDAKSVAEQFKLMDARITVLQADLAASEENRKALQQAGHDEGQELLRLRGELFHAQNGYAKLLEELEFELGQVRYLKDKLSGLKNAVFHEVQP